MRKLIPITIGFIFVILNLWWNSTSNTLIRSINEKVNNLVYDIQLQNNIFFRARKPLDNIVIVDIDDRSLQAEGHWPWSRKKIALLNDKITQQFPSAISFDILFAEVFENKALNVLKVLNTTMPANNMCLNLLKENVNLFEEDHYFSQSIAKSRVNLAIVFSPKKITANPLPAPLFTVTPEQQTLNFIKANGYIASLGILQKNSLGSGFINVKPDNDGIIRRAPLIIEYHNGIYPSLALQTIISLFGETVSLFAPQYGDRIFLEGVQIGHAIIPTDRYGQALIPFVGRNHSFKYYSATDVLNDRIPKEALLGKIILIGTTAVGLGDSQATAIQSPFPGVEIQATLINGFLQNIFSSVPAWSKTASLSFILIFGLISAILFPYLGPLVLSIISITIPIIVIQVNNYIWYKSGAIIPVSSAIFNIVLIAIFNMLYGFLFESRRRKKLKEMFGQYVDERYINLMMNKKSSNIILYSEKRELSVLFADIRNFTAISEKVSVNKLVRMLNAYFTRMTEIIMRHHGTIDKYVGDMIMAFWGAPLADENQIIHAIDAALEMQEKIKLTRKRAITKISIGIGINTGTMSVGDMGSRYRRNYTVIGDAVNLAARIEGLTKVYGLKIMVAESMVTEASQEKFLFRKVDKVKVKGKNIPVMLFEVIGKKVEIAPSLFEEISLSNQALDYYFASNWNEAERIFQGLYSLHGTVFYKIFIKRIKDLKSHTRENWNGVFTHRRK
jgi:adenylate cyclase